MTPNSIKSSKPEEPLTDSHEGSCQTATCTSANCSPCRFIWLLMAVYLIVLFVLERFL